ncbi:MAG: YbhB/YbcL family Raf kinase inhibitor-like protein [Halobaculum sp.]
MNRRRYLLSVAAGSSVITGCGGTDPATRDHSFRIYTPSSVSDGSREILPYRFTEQGENTSPPVVIENVPSGTESVFVSIRDVTGREEIPLWLLWNVPLDRKRIPEAVPNVPVVDGLEGAIQGTNARGVIGYSGPDLNRNYDLPTDEGEGKGVQIKGYAVEQELGLSPGTTYDEVVNRINQFDRVSDSQYLMVAERPR